MAVSPKKTTASRQGKRRSHHALNRVAFAKCSNCGSSYRPHNACGTCGYYKGKQTKTNI